MHFTSFQPVIIGLQDEDLNLSGNDNKSDIGIRYVFVRKNLIGWQRICKIEKLQNCAFLDPFHLLKRHA